MPAELFIEAAQCIHKLNTSEAIKLMEKALLFQFTEEAAQNKETSAEWLEEDNQYEHI